MTMNEILIALAISTVGSVFAAQLTEVLKGHITINVDKVDMRNMKLIFAFLGKVELHEHHHYPPHAIENDTIGSASSEPCGAEESGQYPVGAGNRPAAADEESAAQNQGT